MKKNILKIATVLIAILFFGCTEDLLTEQPPNIITAESLYKDLEGFETGINGLYSLVRQEREGMNGSNGLRCEMTMNGTDNMLSNHKDAFFSWVTEEWAESNNSFRREYESNFVWLYRIINSANTIINRAKNEDIVWTGNGKTAENNKNRILAEAHVIRAWAYRHLVFLWGDVPLTVEEAAGSNIKTDWQRSPSEEVWNLIKADLLFGEKYLEVEPEIEGKITKGAVQHYLAELYLVQEKPDSALYWADKVINTPEYQLITERYGVKTGQPGIPFMDMFYDGNSNRSEGNTEALWVWQWEQETVGGSGSIMNRYHLSRYNDIIIAGVTPIELTVERGGRPRARMSLTQFAIDLYEDQDERGSNYALRKFFILKDEKQNDTGIADVLPDGYNYGDTIWLNWSNPITFTSKNRRDWPYSQKWVWGNPLNISDALQYNDQVYLRLAETYMIKAEAQMLLGNNGGAAETINVIRRRANASEISAADVNIDFILDERSRELLVEEHRRYTLLRTGKWIERTRLYNTNGGSLITERDRLFPIPQSVIDANLTKPMTQNPGYN